MQRLTGRETSIGSLFGCGGGEDLYVEGCGGGVGEGVVVIVGVSAGRIWESKEKGEERGWGR